MESSVVFLNSAGLQLIVNWRWDPQAIIGRYLSLPRVVVLVLWAIKQVRPSHVRLNIALVCRLRCHYMLLCMSAVPITRGISTGPWHSDDVSTTDGTCLRSAVSGRLSEQDKYTLRKRSSTLSPDVYY